MCFYCEMTFMDSSKLKEHTRTLHQDVKMKSILKGIGSYSRIKWDISDLKCKICPKSMASLNEIADHAAKSHDLIVDMDVIEKCCYVFRLSDDKMNCTECGEMFKFFTPLLCHANKYHNKSRRYVCDLCGKGFAIKGTIISHIQNVHSVIANKCSLCGTSFRTRHALTNHCEIVHKVGKFNCTICPQTFKSSYRKKCHLATFHDVKSYQFNCDMCGKVYPDKSKMLRHKSRAHLKEKTVTCHKCGHKAFDMSTLKRHMYSHEDVRPFRCEQCEKTFRWKKNLLSHSTRHHLHQTSDT